MGQICQIHIQLQNVLCPDCNKGVLTKVSWKIDLRTLIFYTADEVEDVKAQVHKCPKCGKNTGLEIAS